jgi:hypothetical protein
MNILALISGSLFIAYAVFISIFNRNILPSISESWYMLEDKKRLLGSIFTFWCVIIAFMQAPVLIDMLEANNPNLTFVGFLTAAGLAFVGCAPLFKGHERVIHRIGAGVAAAGSIAVAIILINLSHLIFTMAAVLAVNLIYRNQWKNYIFWLEVGCFSALFQLELFYFFIDKI